LVNVRGLLKFNCENFKDIRCVSGLINKLRMEVWAVILGCPYIKHEQPMNKIIIFQLKKKRLKVYDKCVRIIRTKKEGVCNGFL